MFRGLTVSIGVLLKGGTQPTLITPFAAVRLKLKPPAKLISGERVDIEAYHDGAVNEH